MPNEHQFANTGKPDTCLWCGVRLRPWSTTLTLARELERIAKLYRSSQGAVEKEQAAAREYHERFKNHRGKWGGLFCTDRCAAKFGARAAYAGVRFEKNETGGVAMTTETQRRLYAPRV